MEEAALASGSAVLGPALAGTIIDMIVAQDPSERFNLIAPWIGGLGMGVRVFGPKGIPKEQLGKGMNNIAMESSAFVD
jgi:hypothetical protein